MKIRPTPFNYKEILFTSESDYDDDNISFTFEYNSFKPIYNEPISKEKSFDIDDDMKGLKMNLLNLSLMEYIRIIIH